MSKNLLELTPQVIEELMNMIGEAIVFIEEQDLNEGLQFETFSYRKEGFIEDVINNLGNVHEALFLALEGYDATKIE